MDRLSFSGVEYVKASVVAKDFKYTADYLGQLCRAKKIDARMIGRIWFIQVDSLKKYKQQKHQKAKTRQTGSVPAKASPHTTKSKVPVVQTAKNLKRLAVSQSSAGTVVHKAVRMLTVTYEADDEHVLPSLVKKHLPPPTTLPVSPVGAQDLKVTTPDQTTSFQATAIPTVVLSGAVPVESYSDKKKSIKDRDSFKNKKITAKSNQKKDPILTAKPTDKLKQLKVSGPQSELDSLRQPKKKQSLTGVKSVKDEIVLVAGSSFVPQSVQTTAAPSKTSVLVSVSPLIATGMALLCVLIISSSSMVVEVTQTSYDAYLVAQLATLLEVLRP